jgi:hypothetical protein
MARRIRRRREEGKGMTEISYEAQRKVAYQAEFELLNAAWDLKSGRTVELRIVEKPGEDLAHPFKKYQKRRGGRVGSRFHAVFTFGDTVVYDDEAMLASWGEGSEKGLYVKFWLDEEALSHPFAGFQGRAGKNVGNVFCGVFVEIDDDQSAIDQGARDRLENKAKLSSYAYRLARLTPTFLRWLDEKVPKPRDDFNWSADMAHSFIRVQCSPKPGKPLESLADLDIIPEAAKLFHERVRLPYYAWMRDN